MKMINANKFQDFINIYNSINISRKSLELMRISYNVYDIYS